MAKTKAKKPKKVKPPKVDGLGQSDIENLRKAIRQVWSWSHARKLCLARAMDAEGFPVCEQCKQRVPKVYPDHTIPAGVLDAGYIKRMFCPSAQLQALCKKCHAPKTAAERKAAKELKNESSPGTERDHIAEATAS